MTREGAHEGAAREQALILTPASPVRRQGRKRWGAIAVVRWRRKRGRARAGKLADSTEQ